MWRKQGKPMENSERTNGWTDHPCLDGRKPCRAAPVKHLQTNRWHCRGHESQDQFYSSQSSRLRLIPSTHLSPAWRSQPLLKRLTGIAAVKKPWQSTRDKKEMWRAHATLPVCWSLIQAFDAHPWGKKNNFQLGCIECLRFSPQNLQKSAFATLWSIWFELQTSCQNPSMDDSKMNNAPRPSAVPKLGILHAQGGSLWNPC